MAKTYNEYIEMRERRFNYFPQTFKWHGLMHHVQAVERCWTKLGGPITNRRARRLCFRVRTVSLPAEGGEPCRYGRFDLYHDLAANTWHLERQLA